MIDRKLRASPFGSRLFNAFLAVLAVFIAAVSVPAHAADAPGAPVEIRVWHALSGTQGQLAERMTAAFNESQRDYRVVLVYKGDYRETLTAGLAAAKSARTADSPHLIQVYEEGTADVLAARNAFKPLFALAAETRINIEPEKLSAPAASVYTDKTGRLLAFPLNSSTPVLYLNRDTFIKAGMDPDKPPKTWYEMQPVLIALQNAGADCPYTTSRQSWIHVENTSAWHNNPVASEDNGLGGTRAELRVNGHLMIRHISLLGAWVRSQLFRISGRADEGDTRFASGECAMLTSSSTARAEITKKAQFRVGVAQLPYYDDFNNAPYNTLSGGAALWAFSNTTARESMGMARFLAYLATPAVAADWQQSAGYVPVTQNAYSTLQRSGYYKTNPEMDIAATQLRGYRSGPFTKGVRLGDYDKIRAILDDELDDVWKGVKAPKSALDEAVQRGNVVLRAFERAQPR